MYCHVNQLYILALKCMILNVIIIYYCNIISCILYPYICTQLFNIFTARESIVFIIGFKMDIKRLYC